MSKDKCRRCGGGATVINSFAGGRAVRIPCPDCTDKPAEPSEFDKGFLEGQEAHEAALRKHIIKPLQDTIDSLTTENKEQAAELERLKNTNRKLNKRCQERESQLVKGKSYEYGCQIGRKLAHESKESKTACQLRQAMQKQGATNTRLKVELKAKDEEIAKLKGNNIKLVHAGLAADEALKAKEEEIAKLDSSLDDLLELVIDDIFVKSPRGQVAEGDEVELTRYKDLLNAADVIRQVRENEGD
jgi:hypothetical protein